MYHFIDPFLASYAIIGDLSLFKAYHCLA